MVFSRKTFISLASITSIIGFNSLIAINSVNAYSVTFENGGFQDPIDLNDGSFADGWEGAGDTFIQGTYSTVQPFPIDDANTRQAVITNACPGTSFPNGECQNDRNDDPATSPSNYNKSGNDQISASIEATDNLQSILNLSPNDLSIPREIDGTRYDGTNGNPLITRTPKEGSAIYQDITIIDDGSSMENFILSFNWDFLTNDGAENSGSNSVGDQDFAFVSISDNNGYKEVFVLEDSTGSIPTVPNNSLNFANLTASYSSYNSQELALNATPGTYRVGFGVVDVDGTDRSSALLIDDFDVYEVPFEFSPSLGLFLMGGLFGFQYLNRKQGN